MLHWQITYINGNIDKLVRNTNCNVSLITYLKGRDVISDREVDLLCDESKPPQDRALKLYKTLQTRTGGHKVLKDALSHTRQTGALRLLNTGSERNDRCVKYKKLEYDKNVIIQKICNNIVVYAGEFGTRPAAVKVFLGPGSNNNMRTAENELDVLTSLDWHEIIVRCFIGKTLATGIRSRFVIALDYRKTLQKVSMDTELGGMAVGMINQILSGVSFLHRHRVIHLNLKPEKIFVDQRDSSYVQLKIGEFGVSRRLPAGENSINVYMGTVFEKGAASFETPEVLIFGDGLQSQDDMVHIDVPLVSV